MNRYSFTAYFENEVLRKRSYLKKEWCLRVIENPIKFDHLKKIIAIVSGASLMKLKGRFCGWLP
jgi:hypothetical protein